MCLADHNPLGWDASMAINHVEFYERMAAFLEQHGQPEAASLTLELRDTCKDHRERIDEALRRLYEPWKAACKFEGYSFGLETFTQLCDAWRAKDGEKVAAGEVAIAGPFHLVTIAQVYKGGLLVQAFTGPVAGRLGDWFERHRVTDPAEGRQLVILSAVPITRAEYDRLAAAVPFYP